eukprot:COSAG02_NODE_902_length_16052_cov_55.614743_14_plen_52_part_00
MGIPHVQLWRVMSGNGKIRWQKVEIRERFEDTAVGDGSLSLCMSPYSVAYF